MKNKIYIYDIKYAGEEASSKLQRVRDKIKEQKLSNLEITNPEEVCWLLNLRGTKAGDEKSKDVSMYTPVFLCRMYIGEDLANIYVNQDELSDEVREHLDNLGIKICDFESEKEVENTFISEMMMIKNETEIKNIREIYKVDGQIMTELISYLKSNAGKITEKDAIEKLEQMRLRVDDYFMPSFETIMAYMENAANIHYRNSEETNKLIEQKGIVMVDAGGQYLRGTTDTTRTIALGEVTDKMKELYTAVLKGHLDVMINKYELGTRGDVLDEIARAPLRELGYDYSHGTGHGVGCFLSVHEHPLRVFNENVELKAGMVFSNEPGVYLDGEFGIRIENVVYCRENDDGLLELESLTEVPYEENLIIKERLSFKQLDLLKK